MKINPSPRRRRGFTLVELMVVVLIIAVLAALVVPRVQDRLSQAKVGSARSQISRFASVLNQFRVDCDRFPTTEEGLNALLSQPSDISTWKGPYLELSTIPPDPWGFEYTYISPGPYSEDSFSVGTNGPDGQEGTDDDITNLDL
ncbi:MAG TPA: type II secretion system major pseudopilin GspG [Fimbriimonas sp.]|nr:type II secretion system major pseudopilin GspG [Fimbriimonas sp.]